MFALILVLMYLPMPIGLESLAGLSGMAMMPFATQERTRSGSIPSFLATSCIWGVMIPFFASSMSVIVIPV
jgi:hypothetical protein